MSNAMKRTTIALSIAALCAAALPCRGDLWINEFHYDDAGDDGNEFVEVVLDPFSAGLNLSTIKLTLYNGANGMSYDTETLNGFVEGTGVNGYRIFSFTFPLNGIQNGAPDGLALSVNNVLVPGQFLSYEGSFTALNGDANGQNSVDISVAETGTTPDGESLRLAGTGDSYADFQWQAPAPHTKGLVNLGQTLVAPVPEASAFLFGGAACALTACGLRTRRRIAR
jgi:hypothetical protein